MDQGDPPRKRRPAGSAGGLFERLRQSRGGGPGLVDRLPGMAYQCRYDRWWTMEFVSHGAFELTGYDPDELVGNRVVSYEDLIESDDRARVRDEVERAVGRGEVFEVEYRIRLRDGKVRWVRERGAPVLTEGGELLALEGFVMDIHRRKLAEAATVETEQRFHTLVEGAPDPIFIQTERRFTYLNREGVRLFGADQADDLLGESIFDRFHPQDHDQIRERIARLNEDRESVGLIEETIVALDGREVPVEVSAVPVTLWGKDGAMVFLRDISERKAREEQLVRLNRTYRMLSSSNRAVLHATTEEGILEAVGRIAVETGGYPFVVIAIDDGEGELTWTARRGEGGAADERSTAWSVRSEAWSELVGPVMRDRRTRVVDDLTTYRDAALSEDAGPGRPLRSAALLPLSTGDRTLGAMILPFQESAHFDDDEIDVLEEVAGDLAFGIAVQRDRLHRRELEEKLHRSERLQAIGQLAGGIAHDFNNSLTVISSLVELLLAGSAVAGEEARQDLEEIRAAAERSAHLTRQLLAFSRRQSMEPAVVDLSHETREMASLLGRLLGERVELIFELEPDLQPVLIDPGQAEQIVMNLAVNARDAMPEGGVLRIGTENVDLSPQRAGELDGVEPGPHVLLTIRDTGRGMPAEMLQQIFDPFFTTKEDGTGLGLATVYGTVRQSGGCVEVESAVGEGTSFRILLPVCDAEIGEWRSERSKTPSGVAPARILLVEDDPAVRRVARRILERGGHAVMEAGTGRAALALLDSEGDAIDLLLTDVGLPDLRGPELVQRVRARRPEMPVVFSSGYLEGEGSAAEQIGSDQVFLPKPFDARSLIATVEDVLRRVQE